MQWKSAGWALKPTQHSTQELVDIKLDASNDDTYTPSGICETTASSVDNIIKFLGDLTDFLLVNRALTLDQVAHLIDTRSGFVPVTESPVEPVQDIVAEPPEPEVTQRGFAIYGTLTDENGSTVRVQQSSVMSDGDCVRIFTENPDPRYENPSPHLNRKQLHKFIQILQEAAVRMV